MNQIWLQIFGIMILGSVVKYVFVNPWVWVLIDLLVLGVAYLIIRRNPYLDLFKSMLFLGGLTLISILVDVGIISGMVGNVLVLLLVLWVIFNGRKRRGGSIRHKWNK